jgi:hypothetical protein
VPSEHEPDGCTPPGFAGINRLNGGLCAQHRPRTFWFPESCLLGRNGVVATMFGFNRREILILAILMIPIAAVAVWVTLLAVNLFTA